MVICVAVVAKDTSIEAYSQFRGALYLISDDCRGVERFRTTRRALAHVRLSGTAFQIRAAGIETFRLLME